LNGEGNETGYNDRPGAETTVKRLRLESFDLVRRGRQEEKMGGGSGGMGGGCGQKIRRETWMLGMEGGNHQKERVGGRENEVVGDNLNLEHNERRSLN